MKLYIRKQSQQIEDGLAFEKVIETLNIWRLISYRSYLSLMTLELWTMEKNTVSGDHSHKGQIIAQEKRHIRYISI
jgi:hypothetical protein